MTHRAEQIVEAVAAKIAAFAGLAINANNVYVHRTLTLSVEQGELDAISVNFGSDEPLSDTGVDNLAFIDSRLNVSVMAYCKNEDEVALRRAMLNLRRQVHQAILADDTLGLGFVVGARYAGASEPLIDTTGDMAIGEYESRWLVDYRMNYTDPG